MISSDPSPSDHSSLERHLSLFDLTSIGVGATIGSGIFVLCGVIAENYAGPATFLSWIIAGVSACLSGVCYAELACHIPSTGSAYRFVHVVIGELPALIAAGCLTLEYLFAGAGVARSWADKLSVWVVQELHLDVTDNENGFVAYLFGLQSHKILFNPMAFILSTIVILVLLNGIKESKTTANFFAVTKVCVVLFMIIVGLSLLKPSNLTPVIPPEFGWKGVFRGATSSFFGYIGFDEICVFAGEAKNPRKNIPNSIMLSLIICTGLYIVAALALTGMQPYTTMVGSEGFPGAFNYNDNYWAAQISAAGEIFTLPVVVLFSIMGQPRVMYALAKDGLVSPWFAKLDSTGNLWNGIVFSALIMIPTASFVSFTYINDMISAGVLVCFSMICSTLLIMRRKAPNSESSGGGSGNSYLAEKLVITFNLCSFSLAMILEHTNTRLIIIQVCASILAILMVATCFLIQAWCPEARVPGGKQSQSRLRDLAVPLVIDSTEIVYNDDDDDDDDEYFKTPFLPLLPCCGIFINWYLISQLSVMSILFLVGYFQLLVLYYFVRKC